jgi:AcrR family transcriptional regulator
MEPAEKTRENEPSTRDALLHAAGRIFAEQGFRAATIRDICQAASANVAAVNYHFGDKDHLYLEALRLAHRDANAHFPLGQDDPALPADERLRRFIEAFLQRLSSRGPDSWMSKIMSREMVEPTEALDIIVREEIRPHAGALAKIVEDLLGPAASAEKTRLCAMSVVSQCLFYHHCRPVIGRLFPGLELGPKTAGTIAAHITEFSLAALRSMAQPASP